MESRYTGSSKIVWFALVFTAFAATLTSTAFADAADPAEPFALNGYRMNAIEYWGRGGYAGGAEVSFGFRTNANLWNQECARATHAELVASLTSNSEELRGLRAALGPSGIYIIVSDWTLKDTPLPKGEVWHYNEDPVTHRGGLIKFHAYAKRELDGTFSCDYPTDALLREFARAKRAQILEAVGGTG